MEVEITGLAGLTPTSTLYPIYSPEWGLRVKPVNPVITKEFFDKKCVKQLDIGVNPVKKKDIRYKNSPVEIGCERC